MASFMLKQLGGWVRHPYCTGMRLPFLFALAASLLAQDLPSIKVDVDIVSLLISVRDKRGALVPNLEEKDFTILEDGKAQMVTQEIWPVQEFWARTRPAPQEPPAQTHVQALAGAGVETRVRA